MDENLLIIIASVITIIAGLISGGILIKLRSFLGNLQELLAALQALITNGATTEEIETAIKELQETAEDGLGLFGAIKGIFIKE